MDRLLLVDDDPDVRQIIRLWLRREWEIDEAASAQDALARCRDHGYAAIVLDQRMPHVSGVEIARRLREAGDDTPIVLFSAFLDAETVQAAQRLQLTVVPKDEVSRLAESLPAAGASS